jgi:hypothetical protein
VARAGFTLVDGQLGDDTGVDGEIVDQGGPGRRSVMPPRALQQPEHVVLFPLAGESMV